jgi:hypothetical protein
MMMAIADLVGYDKEGNLALIVEVKARTNTSSDWAAKLRQNILADGLIPFSRYFMILLPDKLYLWKNIDRNSELSEPTFEIDSKPFFSPYFKKAHVNPEEIGADSFELIASSWVNQLVILGITEELPSEERKSLVDSGLLATLKGGRIATEQPI